MEMLMMNWKLIAIAALMAALALMSSLYLNKRDELTTYRAGVEALGKAAEIESKRLDDERANNLVLLRKFHENQVPTIRANAVANYLAHRVVREQPGGSEVPSDPASIRMDDDALGKFILDETLIRECSEDASKVAAWQDYCRMNQCPVIE